MKLPSIPWARAWQAGPSRLVVAAVLALGCATGSPAAGSPAAGSPAAAAGPPSAGAPSVGLASWGQPANGWTWPLEPRPAVVHPFDPPLRPWLSGHRGVDLGAAQGAQVLAPEGGTVVFAGWVVDRPVVTIDHGGGIRSSFEPVEATVAVGARVEEGQPLGALVPAEAGHCVPDVCLHWGVRRGDEYLDPLSFLEDRRPSVLLPWE